MWWDLGLGVVFVVLRGFVVLRLGWFEVSGIGVSRGLR